MTTLLSLSVKTIVQVPVHSVLALGTKVRLFEVMVLAVANVHDPTNVPVRLLVQHDHSAAHNNVMTLPTTLVPVVGAATVE